MMAVSNGSMSVAKSAPSFIFRLRSRRPAAPLRLEPTTLLDDRQVLFGAEHGRPGVADTDGPRRRPGVGQRLRRHGYRGGGGGAGVRMRGGAAGTTGGGGARGAAVTTGSGAGAGGATAAGGAGWGFSNCFCRSRPRSWKTWRIPDSFPQSLAGECRAGCKTASNFSIIVDFTEGFNRRRTCSFHHSKVLQNVPIERGRVSARSQSGVASAPRGRARGCERDPARGMARHYFPAGTLPLRPTPNWSPVAHRHAVDEDDLDHLLAVDLAALLVRQRGDDLLRLRVDHLAGRRIGVAAVEAERDPARLLAQLDARRSASAASRVLSKTCTRLLAASHHPDLLLVRRQADAVAGAAVPLDRALLEALAPRRGAASCRSSGRRSRSRAAR